MRFLYLDDSGSPGNANEQYFILAGICIPESSIRWLSHELEKLACQIDPQNPELVEFHAAEIYRGSIHPWNKIPDKSQRREIIKNVLCVLNKAKSDIVVFACAIHKPSFPTDDPVLLAYEEISNRFNTHLEKDLTESSQDQERGIMILDKSSYETGLQNLANTFRKSGNRWGYQLRSIIEVPLFVDSTASRIIQLADHIAYAIFRRYEASDLNYFNCIENRLHQKNGIIHGLVHRQTYNMNCTCPACISRRS